MSAQNVAFATAGAVAVLFWLAAGGVHTFVWLRTLCPHARLDRLADALTSIGLILALVSWARYAAGSWPAWAPMRAVQASGMAIAALALQTILARRRGEEPAALLIYGSAIVAHAYALSAMWWGGSTGQSAAVLPAWMVGRDLAAMAGDGALAVCLSAMAAGFLVRRGWRRLPEQPCNSPADPPTVEDATLWIALAALTVSLSLDAGRAWMGWGEVMQDSLPWLLIAWLLLAAGVSGLMTGAASRRVVGVLILLSFLATFVAVTGAT